MIGQRIESKRAFPIDAVLFGVIAVALLAISFASGNRHFALAGVLPAILALLLTAFREPFYRAEFTEQGLVVESTPPRTILYDQMEGLRADRPVNPYQAGPRHYIIRVIHSAGVEQIPSRLNVSSDSVYSFLYHRFSSCGSRDVVKSLVEYLHQRENLYGSKRVWTYVSRKYVSRHVSFKLRLLSLGVFLGGVVWLTAGIILDQVGWMIAGGLVAGIVAIIVSARSMAPDAATGTARLRTKQASLVICPDGLALCQDDLLGQMRWNEIRNVRLNSKGIVLQVAGAVITIRDVYDRPLPLIHQLIEYYRCRDEQETEERPVWQFDAARLRESPREETKHQYSAKGEDY